MTKRQLRQKIDAVVVQIVEKYKPDKIILFGSAARGTFSDDSDLDIIIIKSDVGGRGIDRQYDVDRIIERNGIALDMIVYRPDEIEEGLNLRDPFIVEAVTKGEILYG